MAFEQLMAEAAIKKDKKDSKKDKKEVKKEEKEMKKEDPSPSQHHHHHHDIPLRPKQDPAARASA